MTAPASLVWRKSGRCMANSQCIEVAMTGAGVLVRDSTRPAAEPLSFTAADWAVFLVEVRGG